MKNVSKLKPIYMVVVGVLVAVMIATTAVSFVYWKSGLGSAASDKNLNLQIGSGASLETVLEIGDAETVGRLIPQNRVAGEGEITEAVFEIALRWTNAEGADAIASEDTFRGNLNITNTAINVGGSDFLNAVTYDDARLFEVGYAITLAGGEAVDYVTTEGTTENMQVFGELIADVDYKIIITVRLNEPYNSTQYYAIRDELASFSFVFEMLSQSEQGTVTA